MLFLCSHRYHPRFVIIFLENHSTKGDFVNMLSLFCVYIFDKIGISDRMCLIVGDIVYFEEVTMSYDEQIYTIGVVERMTDIPAATLRIWERRYDFPESDRTEGGHRLYSEREVRRLRWVKAKIDAGMHTRQAIKALQLMEAEGEAQVETQLSGMTTMAALNTEPVNAGNVHISALQTKLFSALLAHDTGQADQIFNDALALYSPENLIADLITPTLRDIGSGWEQGEITVATEHLATNYLRQHLLAWMRTGPPLYTVPPVVLACAPGEWHEGGLLMFGVLLRRRRWPIAYLGQSTPLPEVAKFVQQIKPLAVVLTATTEEPALTLAEWPTWLPEAAQTGDPVVSYAGLVFNERPEIRAKVQGLFLGTTLQEGVETLERLLRQKGLQL
jgi:DNA-binding transcriptional MerR regulator